MAMALENARQARAAQMKENVDVSRQGPASPQPWPTFGGPGREPPGRIPGHGRPPTGPKISRSAKVALGLAAAVVAALLIGALAMLGAGFRAGFGSPCTGSCRLVDHEVQVTLDLPPFDGAGNALAVEDIGDPRTAGVYPRCTGAGRDADIRVGARVVVRDTSGNALNINDVGETLDAGGWITPTPWVNTPDGSNTVCQFQLQEMPVPRRSVYEVQVANRPPLRYTHADLEKLNWTIHLRMDS
jgi:hypothetical protein